MPALALTLGLAVAGSATPASAAAPRYQQIIGYHGSPARCLDVLIDRSRQDAEQWRCSKIIGGGRKWRFRYVGTDRGHRLYEIVTPRGNCLETEDGSVKNGTTVQLWTCRGQLASRWWFDHSGPWVKIRTARRALLPGLRWHHMCLEISDSSHANGADAQIWVCKGQRGTHWRDNLPT